MTLLKGDRAIPVGTGRAVETAPPADAPAGRAPTRRRRRFRAPVSGGFLLRRALGSVFAVWGAMSIVFLALHSSGDPATLLADPNAGAEEIARISALYGYDRPLLGQYLSFFGDVLTGDFPDSIRYRTSPVGLVFDRLPATLLLTATGLALGAAIGLSVGYVSAVGRRWHTRSLPLVTMNLLQAVPPILLGVLLVLVFSIRLHWLPTGGSGTWQHLVLPSVTLAAITAPSMARVFRASILSIRGEDHVRTAAAKGLSPRRVRIRHVAANALTPVVTLLGLQAGALLGGAVLIESLYSWPGVGQLAVNAAGARDYPVVLATVTMVAVGFVFVNLAVDVLLAVLDPRVRGR